ncbi:hypothetical protein [Algivirga pacifica]|uniref:Uncharacterized protein n=1 Tax=Algivirga pacifica TaxID=1162670 RepID=A0ABP9D312_9BACT
MIKEETLLTINYYDPLKKLVITKSKTSNSRVPNRKEYEEVALRTNNFLLQYRPIHWIIDLREMHYPYPKERMIQEATQQMQRFEYFGVKNVYYITGDNPHAINYANIFIEEVSIDYSSEKFSFSAWSALEECMEHVER